MPDGGGRLDGTEALAPSLRADGFARLAGPAARRWIGSPGDEAWGAFARSWNDLGPDLYMADGGRYRRRRHAAFHVEGVSLTRKPHQPHYQSRDYNRLNGGVERWFEPIAEEVASSPILQGVLRACDALFSAAERARPPVSWHVEVHQFRIEAGADTIGKPTPEGFHRDGVDWVFVMLIDRQNVLEGVTEIASPEGRALGGFTLIEAGDSVLLDDRRVLHGVTPIRPADPGRPAWRDVLVTTYALEGPA